jgi:hypothetical protein
MAMMAVRVKAASLLLACPIVGAEDFRAYLLGRAHGGAPRTRERWLWDKRVLRCRKWLLARPELTAEERTLLARGRGRIEPCRSLAGVYRALRAQQKNDTAQGK